MTLETHPNIKESWLFQYANLLPLNLTDEENEAEELLFLTAKNCSSVYFKTIVALVKCVQVNMLECMQKSLEKLAGESLSDDKKASPTMAERMKDFGLDHAFDENYLSDIITIMQSDGIELSPLGMNVFLRKKVKEFETNGETQNRKKKTIYWCFTAAACVVDFIFAFFSMKDAFVDISGGAGLPWATLWPAWIAVAVTLLATGILSRFLIGDGDSGIISIFLEVMSILICALILGIALAGLNFLIGLLRCAIGYAVPVVIFGAIGLAICATDIKE